LTAETDAYLFTRISSTIIGGDWIANGPPRTWVSASPAERPGFFPWREGIRNARQ